MNPFSFPPADSCCEVDTYCDEKDKTALKEGPTKTVKKVICGSRICTANCTDNAKIHRVTVGKEIGTEDIAQNTCYNPGSK